MDITIVKVQSVQAYGARDPRRVPPQNDPPVGAHIDDLLAAEGSPPFPAPDGRRAPRGAGPRADQR